MLSRCSLRSEIWVLLYGFCYLASCLWHSEQWELPLRKPVDVPFGRNYVPTWAFDHIKYFNGGSEIQLHLDKYTGTGFQSKGSYLFGHFSMQMKLVPGDSAGTVTAFYLSSQNSEHDEIDFEFLGNRTGQPYILQTNVFTGGKGDREQRIYLWFDPTVGYHHYSVLWNSYLVVFFVDDVPIRVFKNCKDLGLKFPFNQPMKIYSSLWNADDWATRGGLEKTDWSKAPFIASYKSFHIDGCEASVEAKFCATQGTRWWDQKEFQDLDAFQYRRLKWSMPAQELLLLYHILNLSVAVCITLRNVSTGYVFSLSLSARPTYDEVNENNHYSLPRPFSFNRWCPRVSWLMSCPGFGVQT
ncbi:hypothetical protein OIU77_022703 [Salix suchowensis]|uniref:GH16 domain-containing protein n=1 Tax=Salix suchowensis TaxID=1278906 RepID=A0ABQ9C479_9ROSI|nr:hypothetical protein OIU77_022703 [Salix suchowensis]